jgi:hypothetical protein
MNTSKLFHTVVVLGMALAAESACSSETSPTPVADAGSSGATSGGTTSGGTTSGGVDSGSGGVVDSGTSGAVADASKDAFAGWFCCG